MIKRFQYVSKYFVFLPLLQLGIGLVLGVLFAKESVAIAVALMPVFVLIFFAGRIRMLFAVIVLFAGIFLGMHRYESVYGKGVQNEVEQNFGKKVEELRIVSNGKKSDFNASFKAESPDFEGKILLKLSRGSGVRYGDVLRGDFFLERPPEIEDFDYEFYLYSQGVHYTSSVFDYEIVGHEDSFQARIAATRVYLGKRVRRILPEPHASLVAGLIWGESASMPDDFEENLSRTGTTHIIAVSGFNVSMVVLFVLRLAGVLPRKLVVLITAVVLALFLLLVGLDNLPALRAGIMGYVVLFSKSIGRRTSFLSLISVPVIIMLIFNPLALFTVSFQLSFTAMFGLVGLAGPLKTKLDMIPEKFREEFAATLSAIIATSPVTISNFGTFSFVALVTNMLVLPLTSILTILGIINLCFGLISIHAGRIFSYFLIPLMDYMIHVINFFGKLSFASLNTGKVHSEIFYVFFLILFIFMIEVSYRKYAKNKSEC